MIRATAFVLACLLLTACNSAPNTNLQSPYAPGVAKNGREVDALLVGHRLMDAGEHELAIQAFSRAALKNGLSSEVLAGLGSANLGLGRLTTAERLLRDAIEKEDATPETWNNLGVVLIEKGEIAEAEQILRRAFALDNGESDAIRDNLRLALAKSQKTNYATELEQDYKLVRQGSSEYLIRKIP